MSFPALPDALADVLADVIAEQQREWKREMEVMAAESRAVIAELRAENAALVAALRERADEQVGRVDKAIAGIRNGEDATPVDPADVRRMVDEEVAKIPRPADGKSVEAAVEPAEIKRLVAEAVAAIPVPKDGRGVSEGAIDTDGRLMLCLTDGTVIKLGNVVGRDADPVDYAAIEAAVAARVEKAVAALPPPEKGEPGKNVDPDEVRQMVVAEVAKLPCPRDGRSVEPAEVERMVKAAVAAIPVPQPGRDGIGLAGALIDRAGDLIVTLADGTMKSLGRVVGKDGIDAEGKPGLDGFGFDDLDVVYDGERGVTLKFVKGERVKEFPLTLPIVLDRGVRDPARTYQRGDGVTFGGSFWIAQEETGEAPGTGKGWRLAVKKGRDGKEAVPFTPPAGPVKI